MKPVFPFLKLPAELRTEIYDLVLGGHIIHTGYPGGHKHSKASCSVSGKHLCCATRPDGDPGLHNRDLIFARHRECDRSVTKLVSLTVTCKQIYQEPKFAIFHSSHFTFFSPRSLDRFSSLLIENQWKAIQNVIVYNAHREEYWDETRVVPPTTPPLAGLRRLRIVVELCYSDYDPPRGRPLNSVEVQDHRLSGLKWFKSPGLKQVDAHINNGGSPWNMRIIQALSPAEIEAWKKRIKHMLLQDDGLDGNQVGTNGDQSADDS